MAITQSASTEDRILAITNLISSDKENDLVFRFQALQALLTMARTPPPRGQTGYDRWDVLAAVEDFAGFRTDDEIFDTLLEMKLIDINADQVQIAERFAKSGVVPSNGQTNASNIFSTDLVQALLGTNTEKASIISGPFSGKYCVEQARERIMEMWALIDQGVNPLIANVPIPPTFWRWEKNPLSEGDELILAPWGNKGSTYTVLDMFQIIVEPLLSKNLSGSRKAEKIIQINNASDMLDQTVMRSLGGPTNAQQYDGLFFLTDDDDYPGAQRPTVPSNAALLNVLTLECKARKHYGISPIDRTQLAERICAFLLEQQGKSGLWGVFLHDEQFSRKFTPCLTFTVIVMDALLGSRDRASNDTKNKIDIALKRAIEAVHSNLGIVKRTKAMGNGTTERIQAYGVRHDLRSRGDYSPVETLEAATICLKCCAEIVISENMKADFLKAGFSAIENWDLLASSRDNLYLVSFLAPIEEGYAAANTTWEQPAHARMLIALDSFVHLEDADLLTSQVDLVALGNKIDRCAGLIVGDCDRGCWYDFNLTDCVFPSNMVFNVAALESYVNISHQLLRK